MLYEHLTAGDLVMVRSDAGAGRTGAALLLAREAIADGKLVLFVDCDGTLNEERKPASLTTALPREMDQMVDMVKELVLANGADVIVIDDAARLPSRFRSPRERTAPMLLLDLLTWWSERVVTPSSPILVLTTQSTAHSRSRDGMVDVDIGVTRRSDSEARDAVVTRLVRNIPVFRPSEAPVEA